MLAKYETREGKTLRVFLFAQRSSQGVQKCQKLLRNASVFKLDLIEEPIADDRVASKRD